MRRRWLALSLLLSLARSALAQTDTLPLNGVLANGYRFAYAERGSGPTLLLVHGALTDYRFWDRQLASLADSFHVVAISRRYHHPNPWRPDDPPAGIEASAADLAAIIRALRMQRPVVVGHSQGGAVVLEFARRFPGLARAVVLAEPRADAYIRDSLLREHTLQRARASFSEALAVFEAGAPVRGLEALFDGWFGAGTWARQSPEVRQRLLANSQTLPSAARMEPPARCAELEALDLPVLLLGSDVDEARRATVDGLAACLHRAVRVTLPGRDARFPRTDAPAFDAAVRHFVDSLAP